MASRLWATIAAAFAVLLLSVAPVLAQSSATYTYDALGRVVTSTTAAGTVTYTYDNANNRTHLNACLVGCNHPPVANNDSFTVPYGGTATLPVLANDTDPDAGNILTVTGVSGWNPTLGTPSVTPGNGSVTYVANAGQTGTDSFTYAISDGHLGTASATVQVTISAAAPIANPSSTTVPFNSVNYAIPLSITGTPTSVAVVTNGTRGTATASGTSITYTPFTGQSGGDSFTYTASNAGGTSAPATVTITISSGPPAPPTVGDVSATVQYATSNNPISLSISGSATFVSVVSGPSHGTATASGLGITYTPVSTYYGPDSFYYTATGPGGTSAWGHVTITVNYPPAPVVANVNFTMPMNTVGSIPLTVTGYYNVLSVASGPAHGTATISGTTATYTPTSGFASTDSFTYFGSGPGGSGFPATVTITVTGTPGLSASVDSQSFYRFWDGSNWSAAADVNVIATGGAGGYLYDWENVSGETDFTVVGQGSSGASWYHANTSGQQIYTSVWRCRVTDSLGAVTYTPYVTVTLNQNAGQ
jgi:Big-like domain-containing protein/RHS repeat protein